MLDHHMSSTQYDVYKRFFNYSAPIFAIVIYLFSRRLGSMLNITLPSYYYILSITIGLFSGVFYFFIPILMKKNIEVHEKLVSKVFDSNRQILIEYAKLIVTAIIIFALFYFGVGYLFSTILSNGV